MAQQALISNQSERSVTVVDFYGPAFGRNAATNPAQDIDGEQEDHKTEERHQHHLQYERIVQQLLNHWYRPRYQRMSGAPTNAARKAAAPKKTPKGISKLRKINFADCQALARMILAGSVVRPLRRAIRFCHTTSI